MSLSLHGDVLLGGLSVTSWLVVAIDTKVGDEDSVSVTGGSSSDFWGYITHNINIRTCTLSKVKRPVNNDITGTHIRMYNLKWPHMYVYTSIRTNTY